VKIVKQLIGAERINRAIEIVTDPSDGPGISVYGFGLQAVEFELPV